MLKKLAIVGMLASSILVAGCATKRSVVLQEEVTRVVIPPNEFRNKCPRTKNPIRALPANYTQKDVGLLLWKYYRGNLECRQAINAIFEYLARADKISGT